MLFIDYSSAFNTIVTSKLITKLRTLGLNTSVCNLILDFMTGGPQVVRVGNNTSAMLILNTKDLAWVLRSSKGFTAAPLRAFCRVASLQLLGLQSQGTTEGSVYCPVHHRGQASCHPGPLYQGVAEDDPKH